MNVAPQASYLFDSAQIEGGEAFGRYHDLYAVGSDVRRLGPDFHARLEACRLGSLVLFDRHLNDVSHERSPQRVRRDGFSHFTLQLVVSGEMAVEHPDGAQRAGPGDIAVFDLTRPQRTTARDVRLLTFAVPRVLIEHSTIHVAALHGRILNGLQAGLLGDVMLSIVTRHMGAVIADPTPVVRVLGASLALALGFGAEVAMRAGDADDVLERVRLVVEAHLPRRDLSPVLVSQLSGVSRTLLYDLFKPVGGVSRYIQERRVVRLRSLIQGTSPRVGSVSQLAFQAGFASPSHANRSFSRIYGTTPGRFRDMEREDQADPQAGSRSASHFDEWLRALS